MVSLTTLTYSSNIAPDTITNTDTIVSNLTYTTYLKIVNNKLNASLGSGYFKGQLKYIYVTEDPNAKKADITPNILYDGTTITFNAVGDYVLLLWLGDTWKIMEKSPGVEIA